MSEALTYLNEHYPDPAVQSNKNAGGTLTQPLKVSGESLVRIGMKQSFLQHMIYDQCEFENVALTGSQFRHVYFNRTKLIGSSFACCDFFQCKIDGEGCKPFTANNFSSSNFEGCSLSKIKLISSGMLNSAFHNCTFSRVAFQSSTLEGTSFVSCEMEGCDFGSVNVEFSHFQNTRLKNVCFPFYQFPYVIGAADYLLSSASISLRVGDKEIPCEEYRQQLERLKIFFLDKSDWFPVCNICVALGENEEAKSYMFRGINYALDHRNFRMVRYFCQLALHHDLLDSQMRQEILQAMDDFLLSKDIPATQLNYYMTYVGSIRTILYSNSAKSVALHFNIKTNVDNKRPDGIDYVNDLMARLNQELVANEVQQGFQVQLSNYSPYEIVINVLSAVGSVASIAALVWQIIAAVSNDKKPDEVIRIDTRTYRDCVAAKIDAVRSDLLRLQKEYSKHSFSKYIDTVTQQLKTELEELYSDDIMIFKKTNTKPSEND